MQDRKILHFLISINILVNKYDYLYLNINVMKKLILSGLVLTMMSCYSYKNMNSDIFVVDKDYKITTSNGIISDVKVISLKQDSVVIQRNDIQSTISKNDIIKSRERKFSYLQTGAVLIVAIGGPLALIAAGMSNSIK